METGIIIFHRSQLFSCHGYNIQYDSALLNIMSGNTRTPSKGSCRKKAPSDQAPCSVTMPVSLQQAVIRAAEKEDRSFSAIIRRAVEVYVDQK